MKQVIAVKGEILTRLSYSLLFDKEGLDMPVWVDMHKIVTIDADSLKGPATIHIYKDTAIEKGLYDPKEHY